MSFMSQGFIRKSNLSRMKNRNYPKKWKNKSVRKKMETEKKSKEKQVVSKEESTGKADSAKAGNFGQ